MYYVVVGPKRIYEVIRSKKWPRTTSQGGEYTFVSAYKTKAELDQAVHEKKCTECGGYVYLHGNPNHKTNVLHLCMHCEHWIMQEQMGGYIVAKGVLYRHNGYKKVDKKGGSSHLGFGGSLYEIVFHSGKVEFSNDVWHLGEVPERFRDRFPDNAEFKHCSQERFDTVRKVTEVITK